MNTRKPIRLLAFLVSLLLFVLSLPLPLAAEDAQPSLKEASSVYLYHVERMRAVLSKDEDKSVGAGSSVKVLSGLLLCEALEGRLAETLEITDEMMEEVPDSPGFSLRLRAGEVLSVEELLYAAVCAGYNDAFYLLGAHVFGSTLDFLDAMNRRATAMGLTGTHFTDVTGVVDGSLTTARELCRIALEAYEMPLYMRICGAESYRLSSSRPGVILYNRNALISTQDGALNKYRNPYCTGLSAGWTPADGSCVVASAKHETETYLCIVLGARETDTDSYGYVVTNRLLDWVYDTFAYVEVLSSERDICTLPVELAGTVSEVAVRTKDSYSAYLPKDIDVEQSLGYSIRLSEEVLTAPVEEGAQVGYVAVLYEGQVLASLPIYTVATVARNPFMGLMRDLQELLLDRAVLAGLIFFAVALAAWIALEIILSSRRHRRWDKYFSKKIQLPPDKITPKGRRKP